jgi:hypothetical protein
MAVTLAQLRTQVRELADQPDTADPFITDSELLTYINQGGASLHDAIIASNEDYFLTSVEFQLDGTNTYTLPDTFYKLRGVDYQSGSVWSTVEPFSFAERNRYDSASQVLRQLEDEPLRAYRVMQNALFILPENNADGTYRLWYLLQYSPLAEDADELADLWSEYVVTYAVRKCLQKEESSTAEVDASLAMLLQRVTSMTAKRNVGVPRRIAEVRKTTRYDRWGRR